MNADARALLLRDEGRSSATELAEARGLLTQRLEEARALVSSVSALPTRLSSLHDEGERLVGDLRLLQRRVFNGEASVKLSVSGARLKRATRRLCEALARERTARAPFERLASELRRDHPGHEAHLYEAAAAALFVLADWDAGAQVFARGVVSALHARNLLTSLSRDGKLRFGMFVCCPADFSQLEGDAPENYLVLDMHGSVLSRQTERLRALFRALDSLGLDVELLTIVGDTDEDEYIWRGVPGPAHLDRAALELRRDALLKSVARYMSEPAGRTGAPRVLAAAQNVVTRLSAWPVSPRAEAVQNAILREPSAHVSDAYLRDEGVTMRGHWRKGAYYDGLPQPDDRALETILVHKFAAYAAQGVQMAELEPCMLLIQTERPPRLRAEMLGSGRAMLGIPALPALDFFGSE